MSKIDKLIKMQEALVENTFKINQQLSKICAMLVSDQILQETVSPEGDVRSPEQCATIVKESFNAGLCLSKDLDSDCRHFEYSVSEFFLNDEEEEIESSVNIPDSF